MASKQLGKLRQWAGEIVSSNKTTVSEDFKTLEKDVELRLVGLFAVTEVYVKAVSKKVEVPGEEKEPKAFPVEAVGTAMINHGQDFGGEAAYGQCLNSMGRGLCKLGQYQEDFSNDVRETWLPTLSNLMDLGEEFSAQRKKLDSRRLALDASRTKLSKAKKDKEIKDAEEEVRLAKARYDEVSDDVQARMFYIQDNEIQQLRDLTTFLDMMLDFTTKCTTTLQEVKDNWIDDSAIEKVEYDRGKTSSHAFSQQDLPLPSRGSSGDQDDDAKSEKRPSSRKSGADSGPNGTAGSKSGLSRWVPGSLRRKSRSKSKSFSHLDDTVGEEGSAYDAQSERVKALFGAEDGGQDDIISRSTSQHGHRSRTNSRASNGTLGSRLPPALSRRQSESFGSQKKLVRALYDYSGGGDELGFKTGDEIILLSEVSDGWWEGELDGRKAREPSQDEPFGDRYAQSPAEYFPAENDYEQGLLTTSNSSATPSSEIKTKSRSGSLSAGIAGKKAPPPPPNRRANTPSLPARPVRSKSASTLPPAAPDIKSPFANDTDGDADEDGGHLSDGGMLLCATCGCDEFQQNRFKPRGHCSACFHSHA
ncbi:hypothetical protein M407DRAFT_7859 [Tulasnella calospora MUT 4182]|uniref:SH3 domain-containing protein n=1 Tax=Tulasnella calospora MUT 4182 TaxID=1051891 RepID=A0A0C3Q8Y9_9AGAM|nr:hypothetical protein M407DRAFT_7859 [Tulasnella calospora MUT 4182]